MKRDLAAVSNFLVWGSGYPYLGKRNETGVLLLAGYLLVHWYWVVAFGVIHALTAAETLVVFAGHVLISAGLAYDVYAG